MTRRLTGKHYVYLFIWACCIGLAAATWETAPLLLGAPFFIALVAGLFPTAPPLLVVERSAGDVEVFENDPVRSTFAVSAESELALVEAVFVLPEDAKLIEGTNTVVTSVPARGRREIGFSYRLPSRRVVESGEMIVRVTGASGFASWEERFAADTRRTVYPAPQPTQRLVRPRNTRVFAGAYPSPIKGEGIEFADVRPFAEGDRTSRINWSAVARTGELYVNDFVTERNTDVVLLIDVFADPGARGASLLDYEARAAATIAELYLKDKNRVGLVELGGYLRYLLPAPGRKEWYRILSTLSRMKPASGYVTHEISHIPPRVLPPQALVVAITGLVDDRFAEAIGDLRARGFDVVTVHVSPVAVVERSWEQSGELARGDLEIAVRIWRLLEQERVDTLRRSGAAVASWDTKAPLSTVIHDLEHRRRWRRRVR